MPPSNQTGTYYQPDGTPVPATAVRERGAGLWDVMVGDLFLQHVPEGTGPECFHPTGTALESAPPPTVRERLIPRHVPTWHAYLLVPPLAVGVSVLVNLLWNWLGGP